MEQYHTFGQNSAAAFLSWLLVLNWYHPATVEIYAATAMEVPNTNDISSQLKKLKDLYDSGILTQEEYEKEQGFSQ